MTERQLKVLVLTHLFPWNDNPVSGIFIREHARAAARYCDVQVIHLLQQPGESFYDVRREDDAGLPVWRVRTRRFQPPLSTAAFILAPLSILRKLRREGFDPDVVHAHWHLSMLPALLIGRLYRKPVVYTEHWSIFLPERPARLGRPGLALARLALRAADLVLPPSLAMRDALASLVPRGARFGVIPNVVDVSLFRPDGSRQREGPRRLITAGLLDEDHVKGVDYLLEALVLLSARGEHVHLDIVGDGVQRSAYERLAERLDVRQLVTFHGFRPKANLADLMRGADLFVLASRFENNPCVLIEALATGLPVVATRVGGVPEIVEEAVGVLVEPHDPRALAAGIADVLSRLESFDSEAIAARARSRYSFERVAEQLLDAYQDVLARRSSTTLASTG